MENFTPISALIGGGLIGLSATILLLGLGRIAGISGIFANALGEITGPGFRIWFLVGLLIGAAVLFYGFARPPAIQHQADLLWLAIAGILVGLGTRIGAGCTSGHGVCGLARGSIRSLVATGTFMAVAVATVLAVRAITGMGG